jgi:O-antigen/teichoic acid export membrane protein
MSREGYERYYRAVILLILFVAVSGSKTGYQQRYRRFESLNSCFLAEYAHWRKLEQVVIFEHPTSGKISVR